MSFESCNNVHHRSVPTQHETREPDNHNKHIFHVLPPQQTVPLERENVEQRGEDERQTGTRDSSDEGYEVLHLWDGRTEHGGQHNDKRTERVLETRASTSLVSAQQRGQQYLHRDVELNEVCEKHRECVTDFDHIVERSVGKIQWDASIDILSKRDVAEKSHREEQHSGYSHT